MSDVDISALFRQYFVDHLERFKQTISREGPKDKKWEDRLQNFINDYNMIIDGEIDDLYEYIGAEPDPDNELHRDIKGFMQTNNFSYEPDSQEYMLMKSLHKYAKRSYWQELLKHNRKVKEFSLHTSSSYQPAPQKITKTVNLGHVIEKYLEEIQPDLSRRSYNERRDCLNYLIDWLGAEYPLNNIDVDVARNIKEGLRSTPLGRNKNKRTRGLMLVEQIEIAKTNPDQIELLSNKSINKYLTYFDSLLKWAVRNRYCEDNPFTGMRVKDKKKQSRRINFSVEEVQKILKGLGDGTPNKLLKNNSLYWGTLIAVYTGARRNEIASLIPDDVKFDEKTGIWYFDIAEEEEEGKEVKTDAGTRIVPIHSHLIERGLLDFVKEARKKDGTKNKFGFRPRLLYHMTYTEHDKWGRKLGRWVNEQYLPALGLKKKHLTLHSLRHSMITNLDAAGVAVSTIQSIVGHEPDTVTTSVYTHYDTGHLPVFKEAIEKLPY